MEAVGKMTHSEFVAYLGRIISEREKVEMSSSEEHITECLKRAQFFLEKDPKVEINLGQKEELRKGKRVSICYDGHYYFLFSRIIGKAFEPSFTKEGLEDLFLEIEEDMG